MSTQREKQGFALLRQCGIDPDKASAETLEAVGKILRTVGCRMSILQELSMYLFKMHRDAVSVPLSETERMRHLHMVGAKRVQVLDRLELTIPKVH